MGKCTYSGLKGLVLDKMPEEDFIYSFTVKDLVKITKHYSKNLKEGTSCCYWGLDKLDFAKAVDLKDEVGISLKFKKRNGVYIRKKDVCSGSSCENVNDNQAAMRELLSQCIPYIPHEREGCYFMLTPFEKGCCEFKAGIINVKLDEIMDLI